MIDSEVIDENIENYIERAKVLRNKAFPWWTNDGDSDDLVLGIAKLLQHEQQFLIHEKNNYYDAIERHNESLMR